MNHHTKNSGGGKIMDILIMVDPLPLVNLSNSFEKK
jgi:hypothetical protein